jgi:hypothetical protein
MTKTELLEEYVEKVTPYVSLAKKAYGGRNRSSDAHRASREYTRLLVEYYKKGGSLIELGKRINSSYPGLRRRVAMNDVSVAEAKPPIKIKNNDIDSAVERVMAAKKISIENYHDQLSFEYSTGVSLFGLAKKMGLSSAAPLYYGVQRSLLRKKQDVS